jgi:hypothetical protein
MTSRLIVLEHCPAQWRPIDQPPGLPIADSERKVISDLWSRGAQIIQFGVPRTPRGLHKVTVCKTVPSMPQTCEARMRRAAESGRMGPGVGAARRRARTRSRRACGLAVDPMRRVGQSGLAAQP